MIELVRPLRVAICGLNNFAKVWECCYAERPNIFYPKFYLPRDVEGCSKQYDNTSVNELVGLMGLDDEENKRNGKRW